jgi:hypothetical protein
LEVIVQLIVWLIGWPLHRFRRLLDRLPDRDPSQLCLLHRLGRLTSGFAICLVILAPLVWLIWK